LSKKQRLVSIIVIAAVLIVLLAGIIAIGFDEPKHETIKELMCDAVLHDKNQISLFGMIDVNPGLIAAFTVTGVLSVFAVIMRIFVIPKFKEVPTGIQLILEEAVGFFTNLAKTNSHRHNQFLGGFLFTAGAYIFVGTMFELFGLQAVTTEGHSVTLPAPLSDINGAIAMGFFTYSVILFGGLVNSGLKGFFSALKDFSLPISMSFRLFGALLSGALVTELVYYYSSLSYGLPVIVGVLFTLLHALIQAYVLTMLTSMFYGEVSEKAEKAPKDKKRGKKRVTVVKQDGAGF
jgi:F-type H+-transporting ATPase subunit a